MSDCKSKFVSKVRDFANRQNLFAVENIIIGVSGGADSMALLTVLSMISKESSNFPQLHVVHVNHGIRKDDAVRDQKFVEDYCEQIGVDCKSYFYDVPSEAINMGKSLEETGRYYRYLAFNKRAREVIGPDFESKRVVAVAHHKDDLAETMLMNLFRGSGLDGLVSLTGRSGNIIRPLLCVTKNEIVEFLNEQNISFVTDYTNEELDCTRNIWRNKVIPAISEVSIKDPRTALNDAYDLLKADSDFIERYVADVYEENVLRTKSAEVLPCRLISSSEKAISSRLIRRLRSVNYGNLVDFGTVNTELVYKMSAEATNETKLLDMPFDTYAFVMSGYLGFVKDRESLSRVACEVAQTLGVMAVCEKINLKMEPGVCNTAKIPHSDIQIRTQMFENIDGLEYNNVSWFVPVYGDEPEAITITNNLTTVKFSKAGSDASKALGKVMSDMHIPKDARGWVLGISYGKDYLWVPGIGRTNGFVNEKSYEAWRKGNLVPGKYLRIEIVGG